jgi:hypothetical protein
MTVASTTGLAVATEVAKHAWRPLGWLGLAIEIFHGLAEDAHRKELPAKRLEAQREGFRQLMWDKFWTNEALYDSSAVREAAFD